MATNLAQAECLGWKWSLWSVPTWLAVQQRQCIFLLNLLVSINDMKHFWTFSITPQPCHSHFCCWLLPISPMLDFSAENWAYGMCGLGWWYNGANMSLSWSYMIASMILNTYELSQSHLSRATPIYVVDCCQFGPSWILGWKWSLWQVPNWFPYNGAKLSVLWP